MCEVWWQHRYDPEIFGCVLVDDIQEAWDTATHIEARGPYLTAVVEL